jgi:hypothetical protein
MGNIFSGKPGEEGGDAGGHAKQPLGDLARTPSLGVLTTEESLDNSRIFGSFLPMSHLIFGVTSEKSSVMTEYFPRKECFGPTRKPKIELMNYCGTVLKNEAVAIVCGGISYDLKQITPACYELDLLTRDVRPLPPMLDYRYTFPVCYLDKRIYVVGGRVFGNDNVHSLLEKCERYDYRTQSWNRIANLNKKRCTSSLAVVNGQVWVFGGYSTGGRRTKQVERYNEERDAWEVVDFQLSVGVDAFNIIPAREPDCFFIYGGKLQDNISNKVVKYNLSTNTYQGFPNSSFDNLMAKCFPISDTQFCIIGETSNMLIGEVFDIVEEKVVKVVHLGPLPNFKDLKKFNALNFTTELTMVPRQTPLPWALDWTDPYPGLNSEEVEEIVDRYGAKNILFGTDLRSYIVEIDSQTGQISEQGVPTALTLACFQGVERILPHVVMFCGGVNRAFGKIFDSAFFFNLETYAVEKLPAMPVAKYTFSLVRLNDYVYAIGGRVYGESSQSVIGSVERFSLIHKTWQSIRGLNIPRCTANAHAVGDRVFIMGGYTRDNNRTKTIETFSEASGMFMAFGMTLSEPTEAGFSFQRGDTVLFCGGRRTSDKSNPKEVLELANRDIRGTRVMAQPLRHKGFFQKGCVYKDFLFVFNGPEWSEGWQTELDCLFLKGFENVQMKAMFEEERRELMEFGDRLRTVVGKYTEVQDGLKHDSFLPAMMPVLKK